MTQAPPWETVTPDRSRVFFPIDETLLYALVFERLDHTPRRATPGSPQATLAARVGSVLRDSHREKRLHSLILPPRAELSRGSPRARHR